MSPGIIVLNLNRAALVMLKEVQQSVRDTEDLRANAQVSTNTLYSEFSCCIFSKIFSHSQVNDDLNTLISVLESPVFQSILNIQDSLKELKKQVRIYYLGLSFTLYLPHHRYACTESCQRTFTSLL